MTSSLSFFPIFLHLLPSFVFTITTLRLLTPMWSITWSRKGLEGIVRPSRRADAHLPKSSARTMSQNPGKQFQQQCAAEEARPIKKFRSLCRTREAALNPRLARFILVGLNRCPCFDAVSWWAALSCGRTCSTSWRRRWHELESYWKKLLLKWTWLKK